MSFAIRFFLGKLKTKEWANKAFAAFDTENPENMAKVEWSAAEKIASKLRAKGMNEVQPVLRSSVLGAKGPLVEGEIERAQGFARELANKLRTNASARHPSASRAA